MNIPSSFELVQDLQPVYIYRHKSTKLPMACMLGGHAGHIIGAIVYFRSPDNEMNMEVECLLSNTDIVFETVEQTLEKTKTTDTDDVWTKFLTNLTSHLKTKKGFTKTGEIVPLIRTPK